MIHTRETTSNLTYPLRFEPSDILLDHTSLIPRLRGMSGTYEERIAIIGSGPVGLNAANILTQLGYSHVTLFEARSEVGGMLNVPTPSFGFPLQASKHLIDLLLRPNIEVRLRVKVENEQAFVAIVENYDAVLLAIGAQRSMHGKIRGENALKGVLSAHDVICGEGTEVPKRALQGNVVIIGGGRMTFDAAFMALEAGACVVHILFPSSLENLSLQAWKRVSSLRKGALQLHPFTMPTSILGTEEMDVCGVRCRQTRWASSPEEGRLSFVPGRGCLFTADAVVVAIDEIPDISFLPPTLIISGSYGPELHLLEACMTSLPNVFAAGDVVANMISLHEALVQGREAANRIHAYLRQKTKAQF
ncbi:FAD-dependent oxidoreductase [Ktedonospora formicarum]|uniref:FAD/NAD(P)-binding domain-containing protein n=1 Tax=Ktedonospora formicarum TaxID=2778364 RepID=A0A8J3I4A9_9CHLR|nr:FAD-dependent oxidoreductase [Ktedonospora formicarum]GHO45937.1 hypothetical protein KSX_41000 [Ktedonospora formicarum]